STSGRPFPARQNQIVTAVVAYGYFAPRLLALVAFVFWVAVIHSRHQRPRLSRVVGITKKHSPEPTNGRAFLIPVPASM
ncbi:MAG: hypothetical protein ACTS5Y_04245, partial [Pollutimonas bauzanensis]